MVSEQPQHDTMYAYEAPVKEWYGNYSLNGEMPVNVSITNVNM